MAGVAAAAAAIAALTGDGTAAAGIAAGIGYKIREPDAIGAAAGITGVTGIAGHKRVLQNKMSRRRLPPRHLMPICGFCLHPAFHGCGIAKADPAAQRSLLRPGPQILRFRHGALYRRHRPIPQFMGRGIITFLFHIHHLSHSVCQCIFSIHFSILHYAAS